MITVNVGRSRVLLGGRPEAAIRRLAVGSRRSSDVTSRSNSLGRIELYGKLC